MRENSSRSRLAEMAARSIGIAGSIVLCVGLAQGQEPGRVESSPGDGESQAVGSSRPISESLNFANGLFQKRNFELAAEEYERVLKSHPSVDEANDARFGLANARLFQKRYQDAQRTLREFLVDAPGHRRARSAWYRLGEVSYLLGDLAESRRALERFTEGDATHPNLETAWTYLGDVCFALKNLPAAKRAYDSGLAAFPKGPLVDRTRYGLGRSLAGLNQPEEALKILEELARSGKRDWVDRARIQIGSIHSAAGRDDEAVLAYKSLERESPNSPLRFEAALRTAEALVKLKRPDEAVLLLKPLADDPAQRLGPQAALSLATIELERDRNQAAADDLDAAIRRFPDSSLLPSLVFRLAEALVRLERPDDARARFLQVAEKSPRDPWAEPALLRALRLAFAARDFAAVHTLTDSFAAVFPNSASAPEVQLIKARALRADKHGPEAIPILEGLLGETGGEADPKEPASSKLAPESRREARYELALAYRENGRKEKADALFAILAKTPTSKPDDKGSGTDPITADAQFLVGQSDLEAGRFREAVEPLEGYLTANPAGEVADVALAHLAAARIGLGEIDAAAKVLELLAERFPKSPNLVSTRLRLAEAALAAKRFDLAAAQFRAIPESAESKLRTRIQTGLGQALWNLKKPAEAASAFGSALEAAPDDPAAPELALARARAFEVAGQTDQAVAAYAAVSSRYGASSQAGPAQLGQARLLAKSDKPADASKIYESLIQDQKRLDQAVASGISLDAILSEWGWALVDAGKVWDADPIFGRILKEFPDGDYAADARFNLAESANSAHDHAKVIELLKPLAVPGAKITPRLLPDVLYRLGRTEVEINDWQAAAPVLDRLIREFPTNPRRAEAQLFRAEAALQLDDAPGALANLSALLTDIDGMNDTHSKQFKILVRRRIVQCLLVLKRWDEALSKADSLKAELSKEDPARAELEFARGRALQGLARLDESRDAYQAVIDIRKGGDLAAQARFMRGESFFHQDKLSEARREFLMVDTLHDAPKWRAAALLEVGKIYERLEQWSEAAHYFQMLITDLPADPHAAEAKVHLQTALDRSKSPNGDRKEDISARVGQQ